MAEQPQETPTELTFICTHNSRRSHMGQIWAQAAAWHFGLNDVRTFSGVTEATAFNPRAVRALRELGVAIDVSQEADNPVYTVQLQSVGRHLRPSAKPTATRPTHRRDTLR